MLSKTKQNTDKKRRYFSLTYTVIDFHFNPLGRLLVVKLELEVVEFKAISRSVVTLSPGKEVQAEIGTVSGALHP